MPERNTELPTKKTLTCEPMPVVPVSSPAGTDGWADAVPEMVMQVAQATATDLIELALKAGDALGQQPRQDNKSGHPGLSVFR